MRFKSIAWRLLTAVAALTGLWFSLGLNGDVSAAQAEGRKCIGATYMTLNNPFYPVIDDELRLRVESRGDVLWTRDPALDQDKQNEQIHDLIRDGVDLLVVNPVDFHKVISALQEAKKAGIPVIVIDSQIQDASLATCTIASDNYGAGVQCAEDLMARRTAARIFLLEHPTAQSGIDRIRGFTDALADKPSYQIIGRADSYGQLELAMPALQKLIQEFGKPDVVMALNDPSALGAMAALEQAGMLANTLVYGVDGAPEAKNMIHENIMTASAAQFPTRIGQAAADAAYAILEGQPHEREITIPVELVTRENVDAFGVDCWQ